MTTTQCASPGNAGIASTPVGIKVSAIPTVIDTVVIAKDGGHVSEVPAYLQG